MAGLVVGGLRTLAAEEADENIVVWSMLPTSFVATYLNSFSFAQVHVQLELEPAESQHFVTALLVIRVVAAGLFIAVLQAMTRRLFTRTASAGALLDDDMTTVSVLLFTVTFHANLAHDLTRSP